MRHGTTYRLLGILGALCVPALGVAALELEIWQDGDTLTAEDLNANFAAVQRELQELRAAVVAAPGVASYCGPSEATNGNMNGYAGAKELCQVAEGCSSSARMCRATELIAALEAGEILPGGWYAGGIYHEDGTSLIFVADCDGYTSNSQYYRGAFWDSDRPSTTTCIDGPPVLCCD